jgi:single-strand DNA-binding protein
MILITIPDGRLCADPKVNTLQSGSQVANLRVASNYRTKVDGEWVSEALFFDVALWRAVETIEAYFRKGSPIVVWGELQERKWTDQSGVEHTNLQVANAGWAFAPKNDGAGEEAPPQRSQAQPQQRRQQAPAAPPQGNLASAFADDDIPF